MAIAHPANVRVVKGSGQDSIVRYLAHVRQDGEAFISHDLDEHLRGVMRREVEGSA